MKELRNARRIVRALVFASGIDNHVVKHYCICSASLARKFAQFTQLQLQAG